MKRLNDFERLVGEAVIWLLRRQLYTFPSDREKGLELLHKLETVKEENYLWSTQEEYEKEYGHGS